MIFDSLFFLFRFLPLFLILYFLAPKIGKNLVLVAGSLLFYAWGNVQSLSILLILLLFTYFWVQLADTVISKGLRRGMFVLGILPSLAVFFYFQLAVKGILSLSLAGTPLNFVPLGFCLFSLHLISYCADVFLKKTKPQKDLLAFALYVTFFPALLAGPVLTYHTMAPQLAGRKADVEQISYGAKRFVRGLAKEVVLADSLNLLWVQIAALSAAELPIAGAWLGIFSYALYIYFTISGYTDMAIGLGAILGFTLPENFRHPYLAGSVTDFWRRWLISLGVWLKEYVYIPLGGSKKGILRQMCHILLVWLLIGFWHGAEWTFLLWAAWFAFFIILEKVCLHHVLENLPHLYGWVYAMLVVMLGWVAFAFDTIPEMLAYAKAMFGFNNAGWCNSFTVYLFMENAVILIVAALCAMPVFTAYAKNLSEKKAPIPMAAYRFFEKLLVPILLFLSLAYLVGNGLS